MRPIQLFLAVATAALVRAESQTAAIYLQPITRSREAAPSFLAEVTYDTSDVAAAAVTEYEAPELPEDARLVRIGVYDRAAKRWASSTSVASVDNFGKGYSPHVTVSVDDKGNYLGASCRGVGIDAGQTRDFGPQAIVVVTEQGKQPDLNKPVVLSPEGKQVVPEEKSMLQKYVFSPPIMTLLAQLANMLQVLVGVCGRTIPSHVDGRRRQIEYNDFYVNIYVSCHSCDRVPSSGWLRMPLAHRLVFSLVQVMKPACPSLSLVLCPVSYLLNGTKSS